MNSVRRLLTYQDATAYSAEDFANKGFDCGISVELEISAVYVAFILGEELREICVPDVVRCGMMAASRNTIQAAAAAKDSFHVDLFKIGFRDPA
jgi:hypothetical protein